MGLCLGSLSREPHPATPSTTTPATCTMASSSSEGAGGDGKILETPNLKKFSFTELKTATKNFKMDSLLAEGGSGKVFKCWMDEKTLKPSKIGTGMAVAIKISNSDSMEDFQSEVNFVGRLDHPNLVRLLGCCWEDKKQLFLLVYEYLQRGSLENYLFRSNPEPLSWDTRLKIAIGAARGLAFLHSLEYSVLFREFKASDILLDGNYNAKISYFGLAKLGPSSSDNLKYLSRCTVMSANGYYAPDYIHSGHLCVKTVVYGFGVVLLEMLTGLRAFDGTKPEGQKYLVECWKPCLSSERKLKTIMDTRMKGQYSSKAALQAAQLTLQCLEFHSRSRPSMKEVVEVLEGIEAMKEKPEEYKINSATIA